MRAQRGILLKFPLLTRLYFLSADFEERFFKEPAGAAGIPFARGASPCKATELVLRPSRAEAMEPALQTSARI